MSLTPRNIGLDVTFISDPVDRKKSVASNHLVPVFVVASEGEEEQLVTLVYPATGKTETLKGEKINDPRELEGRRVIGISFQRRPKLLGIRKDVNSDIPFKAAIVDQCLKANRAWLRTLSKELGDHLIEHTRDINSRIVMSVARHELKESELIRQYRESSRLRMLLSEENSREAIRGSLEFQTEGWEETAQMIERLRVQTDSSEPSQQEAIGLIDIPWLIQSLEPAPAIADADLPEPAAAGHEPVAAAAPRPASEAAELALPAEPAPYGFGARPAITFTRFQSLLEKGLTTLGDARDFAEFVHLPKSKEDYEKFQAFLDGKLQTLAGRPEEAQIRALKEQAALVQTSK